MPCYQVITARVEFQIGNIEFLKRAMAKEGLSVYQRGNTFQVNGKTSWGATVTINGNNMTSTGLKEKELITFANSLKRAYSREVIDEMAKRNKWMKKQLSENKFQLQKY